MAQSVRDWNPVAVEQALWEFKNRIANGVMVVDSAYGEFMEADEVYVMAEAKAYIRFDEYPAHERKFHVVLAVAEQRKARAIKERAYKKAMNNMTALRNGLDAVRSIGAGVRQAYNIVGDG